MNRILIRSPQQKEDILSSYLLIHHLHQALDELKVYVITDVGNEKYYSFLPFDIEVYSLPKTVNSISAIHKYAYNMNDVFNIDYFFDLGETKETAYIGKAFKAKERFGFEGGFIRNLFLNNQTKRDEDKNIDSEYLRLLMLSGLVTNEMSSFSGNDDDYDIKDLMSNIIFLFEGFSYRDGSSLKLFKDSFPSANIIVFTEDENVELKDYEIIHDYQALMGKLTQNNICICNSTFFYGLLKYMKKRFVCLEHVANKYPFFKGDYLNIDILDNGKIEIFTNKESVPLEKECVHEELTKFYS